MKECVADEPCLRVLFTKRPAPLCMCSEKLEVLWSGVVCFGMVFASGQKKYKNIYIMQKEDSKEVNAQDQSTGKIEVDPKEMYRSLKYYLQGYEAVIRGDQKKKDDMLYRAQAGMTFFDFSKILDEKFNSTKVTETRESATERTNSEGKKHDENALKERELLDKLTPMFWGEEEEARKFLDQSKKSKPRVITALVNELVPEKKLIDEYKKRDLWRVLHDAGIYTRSESNWNYQVK